MGFKVSMIIIQNPDNFKDETLLLKTLGFTDFIYEEDTTFDECMFPGDESVSVGYYNDNIIVCDDGQVNDNFISDTVSDIEKEVIALFPTSEILSVACISTTNYHGYSLTKSGNKVRAKSLNADDGFYFDFGELIEEEKPIHSKSEIVDGKRIWKIAELSDDIFHEDQMMEDFTFEVAKRLLGVRVDNEEAEEFLDDTTFRKYVKA